MHINELEMARALGLAPVVSRRATYRPAYEPNKIRVTLSVRKDYEGLPKEFVREYTDALGKLDAEVRARQEAKKLGLVVWCVLGVE